jgi:general secretion pathway protein D
VIGGLFGDQTLDNNRTELVVFITPRMIETELDLKNVIDELRGKMQKLDDSLDVFSKPFGPPAKVSQ